MCESVDMNSPYGLNEQPNFLYIFQDRKIFSQRKGNFQSFPVHSFHTREIEGQRRKFDIKFLSFSFHPKAILELPSRRVKLEQLMASRRGSLQIIIRLSSISSPKREDFVSYTTSKNIIFSKSPLKCCVNIFMRDATCKVNNPFLLPSWNIR